MSNFSATSQQEQVTFENNDDDSDVHFVLDQHAEFIFNKATL